MRMVWLLAGVEHETAKKSGTVENGMAGDLERQMSGVSTSAFVIRDGKVESSDVVLVRGYDGTWRVFAPKALDELNPRSYFDLREFMEQHKSSGWNPDTLVPTASDSHVYSYGSETVFWVPCWSEWVLRRTWLGVSQKWDEWGIFRKVDDPASRMRTVKEFKDFIERCPELGWKWSLMMQDPGDSHLWQHTDGNHLNQLWFPELLDAPPFESVKYGKSILETMVLVTCVKALGCPALTEGKASELKGKRDEMFQVVDDEGQERDFLPERFKGVGAGKNLSDLSG